MLEQWTGIDEAKEWRKQVVDYVFTNKRLAKDDSFCSFAATSILRLSGFAVRSALVTLHEAEIRGAREATSGK